RTEPFFPLRSRRPLGLTQSRNTAAILPSGLARFARNGITRGRLQPCAKPLPAYCSDNCRVVLFVELHFYNIVVLAEFSEFGPNFKIHRKITYFENLPVEVSV